MGRPSAFELQGDNDSLLEASIRELQRQLVPDNSLDEVNKVRTVDRLSLASFVEVTSGLILEPWQNHLCERLQKLTYQKGQRILLHKPPQHGGSVIVSQRLPAYLIGDRPDKRVRLACYNIEHATKFTGINKSIMQSAEYRAMFPNRALHVNIRSGDQEFYTDARKSKKDAQPSLVALGLITGFVGQGADDLIIDDPYASPQQAASPAIRASTWTFWIGSARVRIDQDTNVVVMFHRYGEEDFAGQLIKEEGLKSQGGAWELISYRAEWDEDTRPEVGGEDPIGRRKGEYLSPRKAAQPDYYESQKSNSTVWKAQFQGKPSDAEGSFFLVRKFQIVPACPVKLIKVCMAWDIASSIDGDWTVGVLMGLGADEYVYVLKVVRFRLNTDERNNEIKIAVATAARQYSEVKFKMPQDPGAAGKDVALMFRKLLKGYDLVTKTVKGDKELRADPWSQYVNAGLVRLVDSTFGVVGPDGKPVSWIPDYVEEHKKFPNSTKKDQIDASSDAFSEIALGVENPPGEDFDTLGINSRELDFQQLMSDLNDNDEEQMLAEIIITNSGGGYYNENESRDFARFGVGSDHEGTIINGSVYYDKEAGEAGKKAAAAKSDTIAARQIKVKTKVRRNGHKRSDQY